MQHIRTLAIVALFAAVTIPTFAQTATPRVDRRERRQQKRIGKGIENGSLTPREGAQLERREEKIQRDEARAKSDGVVTPAERGKLNRELNRDSRAIRRKKHNARVAR
jgi:hypothetical protein